MAPERRFVLLFLSLLVLLTAFGAALRRSPADQIAAVSAAPPTSAAADTSTARESVLAPITGQPLLSGVWSTTVADRATSRSPVPDPTTGEKQIVSYYGNPYSPDMGILGTADLEAIASDLEARVALYDALNGDIDVVPAIHLVYGVAQYHPTRNGLYVQYTADEDVQHYIDFTARHGMLLFLDLQIGHSSVAAEVGKALPYLRYPHVHLALDPEFAMSASETPGVDLGSIAASDVNDAQRALQQLVEQDGLPRKVLIVHQFADSMLTNANAIQRYSNVELIFDMDGFGPAVIKIAKYDHLSVQPYVTRPGIKLFLEHDPDLMSERDVLALRPLPALVIYQ